MPRKARSICAWALAALTGLLQAAAVAQPATPSATQAPAPGRYITRGAWGQLVVDAKGRFNLNSATGHAHNMCSLEGRIVGRRAIMDKGCIVAFEPTADGVNVRDASPKENACLWYCGGNSYFEGEYLRTSPRR